MWGYEESFTLRRSKTPKLKGRGSILNTYPAWDVYFVKFGTISMIHIYVNFTVIQEGLGLALYQKNYSLSERSEITKCYSTQRLVSAIYINKIKLTYKLSNKSFIYYIANRSEAKISVRPTGHTQVAQGLLFLCNILCLKVW